VHHGALSKSAAAKLRRKVEFVNEGVSSVKFEAESQRKHDVADQLATNNKYPNAPTLGMIQQEAELFADQSFVKDTRVWQLLDQLPHHKN
jgi:hypothetical protein